jgi:hypothetical protein
MSFIYCNVCQQQSNGNDICLKCNETNLDFKNENQNLVFVGLVLLLLTVSSISYPYMRENKKMHISKLTQIKNKTCTNEAINNTYKIESKMQSIFYFYDFF